MSGLLNLVERLSKSQNDGACSFACSKMTQIGTPGLFTRCPMQSIARSLPTFSSPGASWIGGWPQRYLRAGSDDGGNRRCEPPRTTQLNSLARSLGLGRLNKRAAKSSALNASETPKKVPRTDMTHVPEESPPLSASESVYASPSGNWSSREGDAESCSRRITQKAISRA